MQEGNKTGLAQGEHPFAFHAIGLGLLGSGIDAGLGQSGEVFFVFNDEFVVGVFFQKVIAELETQSGELFVDLAQFGLLFGIQASAAADEVLMILLHHADLLAVKTHFVAVLIHIVDALEEFRVHHDGVAVLREHGQYLFGDGHHLVVGEAFIEVEKHIAHAVENLPRLVERQNGVLEGRGLGIVDNRVNFGLLFSDTRLKSRQIVFVFDLVERRHLERCRVFGQEGIWACHLGFLFRF